MEKNVVQNGARPKTQIFEMQCPYSGDSHSANTEYSEKGHGIQIVLKYNCPKQPGKTNTSIENFSCTIDEYMKWKYVLNSSMELDNVCANAESDKSVKIALNPDASLTVKGLFRGKSIKDLAAKVFMFAVKSIGQTLTMDQIDDIPEERNKDLIREINQSELGQQHFVYAETIQQKLYVVYHTRCRSKLPDVVNIKKDRSLAKSKAIKMDLIWMKKTKAKNIQSSYPKVQIRFEIVKGDVTCILLGSQIDIQKCYEDICDISKEKFVSRTCEFSIVYREMLAELDLTDTLDQILAETNIMGYTGQGNGEIVVFGINDENANNAVLKIKECVVEKPYMFDSKFREKQIECLQRMQPSYQNQFAAKQDGKSGILFIIGLKEVVLAVKTELDSIKDSGTTHSEKPRSDGLDIGVFYHNVNNDNVCEFLGNSTHLSRFLDEHDCMVKVVFKNNKKQIRVKYAKTSRTKAEKLIKNAESETVCKRLKLENTAVSEKDFALSNGKHHMAEIAEADNVLLIERIKSRLPDTVINVLEETTFKPNRSTEKRFGWAGKYEKRLHIQRICAEDVPCSHQILFHPNSKRESSISALATTDFGLCTNVHLPKWVDGNSGEIQQLRSLIATILNSVEEDKEDSLAMCLDPVEHWTPMTFTSELTLEATNWITNDSKRLKTLILFSLNDQNYEISIDRAQQFLKKYAEGERKSRKKTITNVYEGELNAVEADVLVNTAASNLELKHGKVSAALLATAGDKLQKECTEKYPGGIAKRQVAETEGHNLQCKKVYHITLEKFTWENGKSTELIEDIRESMRLCMEQASNSCFKTIAFPAFGTGTLKYPVDLVASVMFKSVEDFKRKCPNSTLKRILFVIYPKDTEVLEYFKRVASDLDKPSETNSVSREVEIIGLEANVQIAESKILNTIKTSRESVQATKTNEVESDILKPLETTTRVPTQSNVQTGKNDIPTDSNKDDSTFRGKIQDKDCVESPADDKLSKKEKQKTAAGYLNENFNENTISRVGQDSSRKLQEVDAQCFNVGGIRLYAITSNILDVPVDCIVNAANADLSHCGGVALEISKAAGEDVQRECNQIKSTSGLLTVGSVIQTTQGRLNCKMLLHAVGPRWDDYKPISEESLKKCMFELKSTVINCLVEAIKYNMKSIALPTISSGLFRVPKELCAVQYTEAVIDFAKTPRVLERIYFVDTSTEMIDILKKCFSERIEKNQKPMFDLTKYVERNSSTENVPTHTVVTRTSLQIGKSQTSEETNKAQTTPTELNNNAAPTPIKLTTETSENKAAGNESAVCVICMDQIVDETKLKCGHVFCKECIEGYFRVKKVCPTCGKVCGVIYGDQPDGTMEVFKTGNTLAGYEGCKSIGITYQFKSGQQGPEHPRSGTPYTGIQRTAYLPDNQEGREICALLTVAFERRLVFTIGTSRTTGKEGVITWNDIHHKTDPRPNTQFGYPDATYLQRVREELEVKGVTTEDIRDSFLKELQKGSYRKVFVSKSK